MKKYRVISGELDYTLESTNHKMACILAIYNNPPKSMGSIIHVHLDGDNEDNDIFLSTVKVLQDMGYEVLDS